MPPENPAPTSPHPWRWVPSLYFCQGIPNVVMTSVAVVMLKNLEVSNADIAFYTSVAYLPWVVKPLWSPLVERAGRKRRWIVTLQFVLSLVFGLIALALPAPEAVRVVLVLLWVMAFSSATHDIAADGFYLDALPPYQQAAFVGVRSTFFRLASIAGKGGLVWLAGWLIGITGGVRPGWMYVFALLAAVFLLLALAHLLLLPRDPAEEQPRAPVGSVAADFGRTFLAFFRKPQIWQTGFFLLTYRLAEALALKLVEPFLLDARSEGGLGLTNKELGLAYGVVGTASALAGGLLGGWLISRQGLKRMLWPMILVMHVPIGVFLLLAAAQPESMTVIAAALAAEQFGYGFGFTAYMVYMMMFADGEHKTAHYALCTGFMAASVMLPGMAAGWIQEQLGYVNFFILVCVATLPSFLATALIKVDPGYAKRA